MLFLQDYFHDKKHRFCAKKKELLLSEKLLKNLLFFSCPSLSRGAAGLLNAGYFHPSHTAL